MVGKLIVLEGLDGSGKYTQFKLLKEKLADKNVKTLDFPQYDTYFGEQVARYLRGEFGALSDVPLEIPVLLYALDRYQSKDELKRWIDKGHIVLLNRYTSSSFAFQGAKCQGKEREEVIKWIELIESQLPKADMVLFLDVPRDIAKEWVLRKKDRDYLKGAKRDIHERDMAYQKSVESVYKELCSARDNWQRIDCTLNGKILSAEKISEKVFDAVSKIL